MLIVAVVGVMNARLVIASITVDISARLEIRTVTPE